MTPSCQCSHYCTGEAYNLLSISELYTHLGLAHRICGSDVLHVDSDAISSRFGCSGDVFIYNYGCVALWGLTTAIEERIIEELSTSLSKPLNSPIVDNCRFIVDENCKEAYIDAEKDEIRLHSTDPYIKLSFSYGLSQSVKLIVFEGSVEKTIESNRNIPQELIETGTISLSRRALAKKIGLLFAEHNFISLNNCILDVPEFFWKRPKYETYYDMSVKFLDIKQRMDVLNGRLGVIHRLYEILSAELQHVHSSRLEMIVICLIFFELVVTLLFKLL